MLSHSFPFRDRLWFPLEGDLRDVVVYSRVVLARNLASLPFPPRLTTEQRLVLRRKVEQALSPLSTQYHVCDGQTHSDDTRRICAARGYYSNVDQTPFGVVDDDGSVGVTLAHSDHLTVWSCHGGLELSSARRRCVELDTQLEEVLDYAVSLQLGYLRADVRRVGTGIEVDALLHLYALEALEALPPDDMAFQTTPLQRVAPGFYRVQSHALSGESQEETFAKFAESVGGLVHYERAVRENACEEERDQIREHVSRALGIVLYANRLTATEGAHFASLLRFGAVSGVLPNLSVDGATRMVATALGGFLPVLDTETDDIDIRRARCMQEVYRGSRVKWESRDV